MHLSQFTIGSGPLRAKVEAIMRQRREAERQMQMAERRHQEEQERRRKEDERRALEESFAQAPEPPITTSKTKLATIKRLTAAHFDISIDELVCHRRQRKFVIARQVAMYLAKNHTLLSYPQIAAAMDRDHTTVLYAIERVERAIAENDLSFVEPIEAIARALMEK